MHFPAHAKLCRLGGSLCMLPEIHRGCWCHGWYAHAATDILERSLILCNVVIGCWQLPCVYVTFDQGSLKDAVRDALSTV